VQLSVCSAWEGKGRNILFFLPKGEYLPQSLAQSVFFKDKAVNHFGCGVPHLPPSGLANDQTISAFSLVKASLRLDTKTHLSLMPGSASKVCMGVES
jgi:hypothetical protein